MIRVERIEWRDEPSELAAAVRGLVPPLEELAADVAAIVAGVRVKGDAELRELAERFGEPAADPLRVDPGAIDAALERLEPRLRAALALTARNVEAVARAALDARADTVRELPEGQRVEVHSAAVAAAGVYAPRGRAGYPSSVLMCAIPARVAGVERVAVATPPGPEGGVSDAVLGACALLGIDEVYAVGGAQAIAALAYGTESIPRTDVIAGPGNRYVTEAKRVVSDAVGIDGLAGPSELVAVADAGARADWIALDLAAQAEHGADSLLAVLAPDTELLERIAMEVRDLAPAAGAPLALVATPGIEAALRLADAIAPEHLELAFEAAGEDVARERVAGCVFVGAGGATAFGDYAAGSNHVLPTGGAARFGGPLGPEAFMRRTSVVSVPEVAAEALAPHVAAIARAEGYPLHSRSASARAPGGAQETR